MSRETELRLSRAEAAAADGQLDEALLEYKAGIAGLLAARKAAPTGSARRDELKLAASRALAKAEAVKARILDLEANAAGHTAAASEVPSPPPEFICAAAEVPTKRLSDVVGVAHAVTTLKEAVILPAKFPQLFRGTHYRRWAGVLLVGGPGCGKTLVAHAAAGEAGVPLVRLDCNAVAARRRGLWGASQSAALRASEALIHEPFKAAAEAGRRAAAADVASSDDASARDAQAVLLLEEPEALSAPPEIFCAGCSAAVERRREAAKVLHAEGNDEAAAALKPVELCAACGTKEVYRTHLRAAKTALLYELDRCTNLCVVATSARPWDMCYAVRKRLAKRCYLPPPTTAERVELLKAGLGLKRNQQPLNAPPPSPPPLPSATVAEMQFLWQFAERIDGYTACDIACLTRDASFGPLRDATAATHFRRVSDRTTTGTLKWAPCAPIHGGASAASVDDVDAPGDGDAFVGEVRAMKWSAIEPDALFVAPVARGHLLRALRARPTLDAALESRYVEWAMQFTDQFP